jgi:ribosome-associated protein
MNLGQARVSTPLEIPDAEISFTFVRGSGPGGQNVNKVSTTAQLRFNLAGSALLDDASRARLRALAGHRLIGDDEILIVARNHRTQEGNRREALARLHELVTRALHPPKTRRPTRPTRASKERRIAGKLHRQKNKQLRRAVRHDD